MDQWKKYYKSCISDSQHSSQQISIPTLSGSEGKCTNILNKILPLYNMLGIA